MEIKLLAKTPDMKQLIYTAARTCYSNEGPMALYEQEPKMSTLKHIIQSQHLSVTEHAYFTFGVENVSRSLLGQLTRHRMMNFSVSSQRYNNYENVQILDQLYIPPHLTDTQQREYIEAAESSLKEYKRLIKMGLKPQDARGVLPMNFTTDLVVTMNLRAFIEFYAKRREGTGAQAEIKVFAEKLREIIENEEPWLKEVVKYELLV